MSKVEQVARALTGKVLRADMGFDDLTPEAQAWMLELARTAIEAMREPTEGMVKIVQDRYRDVEEYWSTDGHIAGDWWRLMIDEALR